MDGQLALDLRCPIFIVVGLGNVAAPPILARRGARVVGGGLGSVEGGSALGSESLVSFLDQGLNLGS